MGKPDEVLSFAQFTATKLNSEVTQRHLNNRASFAVLALQMLSGCPFDEVVVDGKESDNELELLLTEIIQKKKERRLQKSMTHCETLYCLEECFNKNTKNNSKK